MMTFWRFAATAEAHGMQHVLGTEDAVREMGVVDSVPFTGYVFSRAWAENNRAAIDGFLSAGLHARTLLETLDDEWVHFKPTLNVDDGAELVRLKIAYRRGLIHQPNDVQHAAIA
jgi:NitT/TauT family transport system substrate-binding protein